MDYHPSWYKCCPHWDDVQWPWLGSIPQRSHSTFKGQSTHARFCAITYVGIDFTYTTHNLNNFNKYPSITCSYIQEYLGYRSNNLYFLFSHSWPVVVYDFGQVQRTSQVERKTKCSKKTMRDIAVLWTALLLRKQRNSGRTSFKYVPSICYESDVNLWKNETLARTI